MRRWAIINKDTDVVVTVLGWESDFVTQGEMEETTILKDNERVAVVETDFTK